MKTFKILFAAIIIAGFATTAFASDTDNDAITASAQIVVDISVDQEQDLNFGTDLVPNTNPKFDVTDSDNNEDLGAGATVGRFVVDATAWANFKVTFNYSDLVHTTEDEADDLAFTPMVAINQDGEDTGTIFYNDGSFDAAFEGGVYTVDEEGEDYFIIGGNIVIPTGAFAGTYESEFTLTAEHVL